MNKKSWKQKIATILVCALIISTLSVNTAFASYTGKNITVNNLPVKTNENEIKENGIKESIREEENSPELNRILEECKEVKADKSSKELRKGEIVSVESVSGDYTQMAIMSNGDLYCWGYNGYGQVGNGTTQDQLEPVKVLSDVESVSYSYSSSYLNHYSSYTVSAIQKNGDLYCWGYNGYGQVGNGTTQNQLEPVKVLSNVESVSFSSYYYYSPSSSYPYIVSAIQKNGDLYCWGANEYGQVGNGTTQNQTKPVKVLSNVESVSYTQHYSFTTMSAIQKNGDLYCWGYNGYGQVGNGTTQNQLEPVKVLSDVESVSYASTTVSAIQKNGDLYYWSYKDELEPVKVLSDVKSVSYINAAVLLIQKNGDLYYWRYEDELEPVKVLSNVESVSYANHYTYPYYTVSVIQKNGDLYCWGANEYGQVGNGTTQEQLELVKVLSDVESISYANTTVLAIQKNGDLYCWGYNKYGQVGNSTTQNQTKPVKVLSDVKSVSYSLNTVSAIQKNGDLYCWGVNCSGQVGNGTTQNQTEPIKVLNDVESVSYPYLDSYTNTTVSAIQKNGNLYCWGYNKHGQIGNGTTQNQLTPFKVSFGDLSDDNTTSQPSIPSDEDNKYVTGLKLDKNTLSLTTGSKETLNATIEPSDASNQNILWSSNNTSVAVVSGSGIVTAVDEGTAEIKATTEDGGYEAVCTVTVTKPSPSPSPSQSPSGAGNITSGGVNLTFIPTPEPTATVTPSPSPIVTVAPSATPIIIATSEPTSVSTLEPTAMSTPESTPMPTPEPFSSPNPDNGYEISDVAIVNLGKETFVYNGKAKKPKITVWTDDVKLTENKDYTLTYNNNTKVGTATVTIHGQGLYSGEISTNFKIVPNGTAIKGRVQAEYKGFTVKWKKQPTSTTGYQVQYSTSKKFNGKTTIKTVKKKSVTKLEVGTLKAKKKYYVKVRTYKTVKGKKYYSKWSKARTVITKK